MTFNYCLKCGKRFTPQSVRKDKQNKKLCLRCYNKSNFTKKYKTSKHFLNTSKEKNHYIKIIDRLVKISNS